MREYMATPKIPPVNKLHRRDLLSYIFLV